MKRPLVTRCVGLLMIPLLLAIGFLVFPGTAPTPTAVPGAFVTKRFHDTYGQIYLSRAVDLSELRPSRPGLSTHLRLLRDGLLQRLGRPGKLPTPIDPVYLRVGSYEMEWSVSDSNSGTGRLYFHKPGTNRAVWEFAPCRRARLEELAARDFKGEFYAMDTVGEQKIFDAGKQPSRALRVRTGEVYFARHVDNTNQIFAVELTNQKGGFLEAHFMKMEIDQWNPKGASNQNGAANGSQPFGSETNRTSSAAGSRR